MGWLRKSNRHPVAAADRAWSAWKPAICSQSQFPQLKSDLSSPRPVPAAAVGANAAPTLASFDAITGASTARAAYGVDGTGLTAAVIDMGVNYNHEALGGGFGPGFKVEAGYDFSSQSSDPLATNFQHGTASPVSSPPTTPHPGVAPVADLVALKVFGNSDQGDFDWIANALQWVVDNHDKYNITVVNLSISDQNNYTLNWFATDGGVGEHVTSLIHQLDLLNIPVVTAAGNNFRGQQGMGFAAIVPDSISVTVHRPDGSPGERRTAFGSHRSAVAWQPTSQRPAWGLSLRPTVTISPPSTVPVSRPPWSRARSSCSSKSTSSGSGTCRPSIKWINGSRRIRPDLRPRDRHHHGPARHRQSGEYGSRSDPGDVRPLSERRPTSHAGDSSAARNRRLRHQTDTPQPTRQRPALLTPTDAPHGPAKSLRRRRLRRPPTQSRCFSTASRSARFRRTTPRIPGVSISRRSRCPGNQ